MDHSSQRNGRRPCRTVALHSLSFVSVLSWSATATATPVAATARNGEYPSSVMASEMRTQRSQPSSLSANGCSIYLAPSTIPGAGWGVFAARDFQMGDKIGTPSVGIPFLDLPTSRDPQEAANVTSMYGALTEYLWESADIGGFGEALRVDLFLPGPASLVNHHAALDNVVPGGLTQDTTFHRYSNPMAGSSTAYTNFYLIAKRDIVAGEELWVDRTRNTKLAHPAYHWNHLPTIPDYELVDTMVQGIAQQGLSTTLSPAQFQDMLYRLGHEVIESGYPSHRAQVLQKLLPRTLEEFERCRKLGSARYRLLRRPARNVEWMQTNGQCLDTITSKPSTIPEAGQGAFATHPITKGSIVSLSPMVTIAKGTLAMKVPFTVENSTHSTSPKGVPSQRQRHPRRANATKQILSNYCFGHVQSDLMLCPTTQASLMNHASADGKHPVGPKPNVGIQWSTTHPTSSSSSSSSQDEPYLLQSLESISTVDPNDIFTYQTKLVMEYVALRDIKAGEELLLDYSTQWQNAWKDHLDHGHSSIANIDDAKSMSAKEMNDMGKTINSPDKAHPQPWAFLCQIYPNVKVPPGAEPGWEDFATNPAIDERTWPEKFLAWYSDNHVASLYPCNVVQVKGRYADVEMLVKPLLLSTIGRRYRNVPLDRIQYADSTYHSDMHLEWAFRQYLPIPDAIFPLHWRRNYKSGKDWNLGTYEEIAVTKSHVESYEQVLRQATCGVYLAKSNIPNAGFGTYTAVDIPAAGIVVATMLPVIPIFAPNPRPRGWPMQDYSWEGSMFNAATWEAFPEFSTSMAAFLFGSMANAHAGINNLNLDTGQWLPMLDARTEYGAGAFTDYYNSGFTTKYAVSAGEELFVSYGESWFRVRDQFADVPLLENFREANGIVASVWALLATGNFSNEEEFISTYLPLMQDHFVDKSNKRTMSALKQVTTLAELGHVMERNGTAEATVERRSTEWLEENGFCQDHLYVNRSTIYNAGNGAFLRRFRPKDSLIVAAPLVAVGREFLYMKGQNALNEYQLVTNYLFGHKDSSILFLPSNQAIAINHNSKRMKDGEAPNARIEFSTRDKRSMYFQSLPLGDLLKENYTTMILDIIATRDIEPDEEVFIDYGEDWEEAWLEYVKNWKSPCGKDHESCLHSSKQVHAINYDKFNTRYHGWDKTHITRCFINQTLLESDGEKFLIEKTIPEDFNEMVDPRRKLSYEGIEYDHEGFDLPTYQFGPTHFWNPCEILDSFRKAGNFDVVYFVGETPGSGEARMVIRVTNLPEDHIEFQVRPFQSDIVRPGSFRHEIALPDDQFPPLWKDLL